MTARLSRSASGARHLRWVREVSATAKAHLAHNDLLDAAQKAALQAETSTLEGLIAPLAGAVGAYRGFLDNAHVEIRAAQRVANYLCDEAQTQADGQLRPYRATINQALPGGVARIFSQMPLSRILRVGHARTAALALDAAQTLRALPASVPVAAALADRLEVVGERLRGLVEQQQKQVDPQRGPLKIEVERAIFGLRQGLEQMDGRLRAHFPAAFIESLYPELNRRATAVTDDPDEDDDDSEPSGGSSGDPA